MSASSINVGLLSRNRLRPVCPNSWPVFAVKMTSLFGREAFTARMISRKHAMPPPRSDAFTHHPLRGVITTTGASSGRLPLMIASTFLAIAFTYSQCSTKPTCCPDLIAAWIEAQCLLATCNTGGPKGAVKSSAFSNAAPSSGNWLSVTTTIALCWAVFLDS